MKKNSINNDVYRDIAKKIEDRLSKNLENLNYLKKNQKGTSLHYEQGFWNTYYSADEIKTMSDDNSYDYYIRKTKFFINIFKSISEDEDFHTHYANSENINSDKALLRYLNAYASTIALCAPNLTLSFFKDCKAQLTSMPFYKKKSAVCTFFREISEQEKIVTTDEFLLTDMIFECIKKEYADGEAIVAALETFITELCDSEQEKYEFLVDDLAENLAECQLFDAFDGHADLLYLQVEDKSQELFDLMVGVTERLKNMPDDISTLIAEQYLSLPQSSLSR